MTIDPLSPDRIEAWRELPPQTRADARAPVCGIAFGLGLTGGIWAVLWFAGRMGGVW